MFGFHEEIVKAPHDTIQLRESANKTEDAPKEQEEKDKKEKEKNSFKFHEIVFRSIDLSELQKAIDKLRIEAEREKEKREQEEAKAAL